MLAKASTSLLFDISSSLNFTCLIFIYLKSILFTGVISSQYGIVGEVLLWSLAKVLGPKFDSAAKQSWVTLYSVLLKTIIPAAIEEERRLWAGK
jgi:hemoglobin-like flavoprotein